MARTAVPPSNRPSLAKPECYKKRNRNHEPVAFIDPSNLGVAQRTALFSTHAQNQDLIACIVARIFYKFRKSSALDSTRDEENRSWYRFTLQKRAVFFSAPAVSFWPGEIGSAESD